MTYIRYCLILIATFGSSWAAAAELYAGSCDKPPAGYDKNIGSPYGEDILQAAKSMPEGLKYDAGDKRIDALGKAVNISKAGQISVDAEKAGAGFCSSGAYLVLMKVIAKAQQNGLNLSPEAAQELSVLSKAEQPDGRGFWGRFNGDGPSVAILFNELGIGVNSTKIEDAKPGDFLKFFWNDKLGKGEVGHLTIFDSIRDCTTMVNGKKVVEKSVCFRATNKKNDQSIPGDELAEGGWSLRCVARSKMKNPYISRLTSLNNLNDIPKVMGKGSLNYDNKTIANLPKKTYSPAELAPLIFGKAFVNPDTAKAAR